MIIGHLPAGYLLGRALSRLRVAEDERPRTVAGATMLGSIFPDLDMMYFHWIDHGRSHHHLYWTHLPLFWAVSSLAVAAAGLFNRKARVPPAYWFFVGGVLSHLVLDSLTGSIYWLMPFSDRPFSLFSVQPVHSPWYLNFVLHWVFALELALLAIAAAVAYRDACRYRDRVRLDRW